MPADEFRQPAADGQLSEPLTRRERDVLTLLAAGLTGPEMAQQLHLATSSVRSHVQHLYGKLGATNKRQAIVRAGQLGLVQLGLPPGASSAGALSPPRRHNLPGSVTSFIGREDDLVQIAGRLARHRLVTLTGPGGVGKTRLALRAAESALDVYAAGVWLTELAALSDPALVAAQTAAALGVSVSPGHAALESLLTFLRDRQLLLVLDNCEHLIDAASRLADDLLRGCPGLRILASSREPLAAYGEAVFRVSPLPFPKNEDALTPALASDFPAVRLFVERASLVMPDYAVGVHNAAAIAQICRQLDGLPLAIELAAARINLLTAQQLAGRLASAFRVLTGGSRTALPRHQAMRATIDWSFQLLSAVERLLLQRLSVFAGGCTLEAAEAICSGDDLEAADVLEILSSLVSKSMVVASRRQGEEARYSLVELLREYAGEQLDQAGAATRLLARHQAYFLALAETGFEMAATRERLAWVKKLTIEQDNFRRTLGWSFSDGGEAGDIEAGPRMIVALFRIQPLTFQEWRRHNQRALAWCQRHPHIQARIYARVLGVAAGTIAGDDLPRAVAELKEAVALSRRLGPSGQHILMWNLADLSSIVASTDDLELASAARAEAIDILHALGPDSFPPGRYVYYLGHGAASQARLANKRGRYAEAKVFAAESMELYRQAGFGVGEFSGLVELGNACLGLSEYDQAREAFLKARQWPLQSDRKGENDSLAYVSRCLGVIELKQGHLQAARDYCQTSLREAHAGGFTEFLASSLALAAAICAQQHRPAPAAGLSGASASLYASTGRAPWEDSTLDTLLPGWRAGPDSAAIVSALEGGQHMTADQAAAYALDSLDE